MEDTKPLSRIQQEIEGLVSDQKNSTHFAIDLPHIYNLSRFLKFRLKNKKSKLLIFGLQQLKGKDPKCLNSYKPLIIGVRGLRKDHPSPTAKTTELDISQFFDYNKFNEPLEYLHVFCGLSFNPKRTKVLITPENRCLDSQNPLKIVQIDLQTGSLISSKYPKNWNYFQFGFVAEGDIENEVFHNGWVYLEVCDYTFEKSHFINIWVFSLKDGSSISKRYLDLKGSQRREIFGKKYYFKLEHSYGKFDRKVGRGLNDRDCLVYLNFYLGMKDDHPPLYACLLSYIDLKSKKILFEVLLDLDLRREERDWRKATNCPFLWNDDSIFVMRFGPKSVLLVNRKTRKYEIFRYYEREEFLNHRHFLGMFPSMFKTRLAGALKPCELFQVVDFGSEFCGVYSKVRGSCFRLDEFEKVKDYFFVCFRDEEALDGPYCFLIYPFRK